MAMPKTRARAATKKHDIDNYDFWPPEFEFFSFLEVEYNAAQVYFE